MARPIAVGLNYFPFDVDLLDDEALDFLREEYGMLVNTVYIRLLSLLYKKHGYYIPYETEKDKEDCIWYIFKSVRGGKFPPTKKTISEVIEACVARGLFSRELYPKIITSKRAQATFYSATVERKVVPIDSEIWLLDIEDMEKLSKKHPYYLKVYLENKSTEKPSYSDNKPDLSNEKPLNKTKQNNNPPISPQGEGGGNAKSIFMSAYPKLSAAKNYDDNKVDYELLKKMFDRSVRLKDTYSMKWVIENYDSIISGAFTDKDYDQLQTGARGRWYDSRRHKAEDRAEEAQKRAFQINGFKENEVQLTDLSIKVAFAEGKQSSDILTLKKEYEACAEKRRFMLATIGLTENDLKVKYHCLKCEDTGFNIKTGQICDCYAKENSECSK